MLTYVVQENMNIKINLLKIYFIVIKLSTHEEFDGVNNNVYR